MISPTQSLSSAYLTARPLGARKAVVLEVGRILCSLLCSRAKPTRGLPSRGYIGQFKTFKRRSIDIFEKLIAEPEIHLFYH